MAEQARTCLVTNDAGLTWSSAFDGHIHMLGFYGSNGWMAVGDFGGHGSVKNYVIRDLGETWTLCGSEWKLLDVAPLDRRLE